MFTVASLAELKHFWNNIFSISNIIDPFNVSVNYMELRNILQFVYMMMERRKNLACIVLWKKVKSICEFWNVSVFPFWKSDHWSCGGIRVKESHKLNYNLSWCCLAFCWWSRQFFTIKFKNGSQEILSDNQKRIILITEVYSDYPHYWSLYIDKYTRYIL